MQRTAIAGGSQRRRLSVCQAEDRTGRTHGAGAQRGTTAARSGHWRRCEIEPGEMELLSTEADSLRQERADRLM